MKGQQWKNITE